MPDQRIVRIAGGKLDPGEHLVFRYRPERDSKHLKGIFTTEGIFFSLSLERSGALTLHRFGAIPGGWQSTAPRDRILAWEAPLNAGTFLKGSLVNTGSVPKELSLYLIITLT